MATAVSPGEATTVADQTLATRPWVRQSHSTLAHRRLGRARRRRLRRRRRCCALTPAGYAVPHRPPSQLLRRP